MTHTPPQVLLVTPRFRVVREKQVARDGSPHVREIVRHPGSVAILPILRDGRVCLIRNERIAAGQTLIELPAGTLEEGEDPALAAKRELMEETGYRAGALELLAEFYVSPGIIDERMHLYLATELESGPMALEPGEQIETHVVAWDEAMRLLLDGVIQDAKTLVGLLWYDRQRRGD